MRREAQVRGDVRPESLEIRAFDEFDLTDAEQVRQLVSSAANRLIRGDLNSQIAKAVSALAEYSSRLNCGGEQGAAEAEDDRGRAALESPYDWISKLSGPEIRRLLTILWRRQASSQNAAKMSRPKRKG